MHLYGGVHADESLQPMIAKYSTINDSLIVSASNLTSSTSGSLSCYRGRMKLDRLAPDAHPVAELFRTGCDHHLEWGLFAPAFRVSRRTLHVGQVMPRMRAKPRRAV